jgi:ATP-binding cassette, subfamily B, bacterial PglK
MTSAKGPPQGASRTVLGLYRMLYSLLDSHERRRVAMVFGVLVVVAFVDALGVASIMPFIAVLANPEVVETNRYLAMIYTGIGFPSRDRFLLFLGVTFFLVLMASLSLRALGTWAQLRFSHNRNATWSARLTGGYLRQPYEWFLNRHSADLATSVLSEVNQVVNGALLPAMRAIAHMLVAVFLLLLLIAADPLLAVAVAIVLGGGYLLISMAFRRRLRRVGEERRNANKERFHIVQEAFGGVKDVKIAGLEEAIVRRFSVPARVFASRQISSGLISQLPSFAMQGLLFGGMLLVLLYLLTTWGGFQQALPVVALYAFAGYRLMPAIQGAYGDISTLRFTEPVLELLSEDFQTLQTTPPPAEPRMQDGGRESLVRLGRQLELRTVTYTYPGADTAALRALSMTIPTHSKVGLVGSTGSGKTTTVDLILGLLRPQEGAVVVDGVEITGHLVREWQRSIGYVPQQIYLSDDTVAGNIAFGIRAREIDLAAVERAAKIAVLHDFVVDELPQGYDTQVGERGVRLSGGQRQRIGIARALYRDPDVLVFDEGTSALDNITEMAVMEALQDLGGKTTMILIAHRLSTVRTCDCIYLLDHGRLIAHGKYEDLVNKDERFRAMAELV